MALMVGLDAIPKRQIFVLCHLRVLPTVPCLLSNVSPSALVLGILTQVWSILLNVRELPVPVFKRLTSTRLLWERVKYRKRLDDNVKLQHALWW